VHVIYTLLLWLSYQQGDFSQTYPIARGTAPWVVAVIEIALGHDLPVLQLVGIVVISIGLLSLAPAQTSGATATVAALRETSIVIGALIGTLFLGERFGRSRVVAVGIALVSL
jgi:uncharacterized membrane protein